LATLVTPNTPEAELLLGRSIADAAAAGTALAEMRGLGAQAVLLKGGHLDEGDEVIDRFHDADGTAAFAHRRLDLDGHGTGCTLASAIAAHLCRGSSLQGACAAATDYVSDALRRGYRPGRSDVVVLDHLGTATYRSAPEQ
ncbi:MAG: bifunctional hydroxymethylpyrimidine kinase/phosphomethylpyrimidine kinase, partial [Proteobacteria bacterium]|nr:bifunctional hydroxymethylpyrimidine kinase/phosphomethylpyrimidine kinase [Pseudomonadota bacterium]